MRTQSSLIATGAVAASILLPWTASASAFPNNVAPRQPDATTTDATTATTTEIGLLPWVTVDTSLVASTITPTVTTDTAKDKTKTLSGAPWGVTHTKVVTVPYWDHTDTITQTAPPATAKKSGAGAFLACHNTDGENAPWCAPGDGAALHPGRYYYFVWDPKYFEVKNATAVLTATYKNLTTGEMGEDVFESDKIPVSRGFYSHLIEKSMIQNEIGSPMNFHMSVYNRDDSNVTVEVEGPTVDVTWWPKDEPEETKIPQDNATLYIALPSVFGFIFVCVIGGCIYNRRSHGVNFASLKAQARKGRSRLSKGSRMRKMRHAEERIQLMEREADEDGDLYRDNGDRMGGGGGGGLGSGGNVFRDEIRRQDTKQDPKRRD